MQTVKNLFLWTGRSWVRKAMEAPLALYAELVLSKRRIMEIYLNIAEWGRRRLRRGGGVEALFRCAGGKTFRSRRRRGSRRYCRPR